jgi:outer membrane protein assembly factor BamB
MITRKTLVVAVLASAALSGCAMSSRFASLNPFHGGGHKRAEKAKNEANRVPLVSLDQQLKVSDALKGVGFQNAPATPLADWPLPGGTLQQSVENVAAAPDFQVAWRRSIGVPSSRQRHVTSPPILADGRLFLMDGLATVSAHDAKTGAVIWRRNIAPKTRRRAIGWGGGVAWADGKLYVSSGYREVVSLDGATGRILWRSPTDAPVHAAPTVSGGRVFVEDVNDELLALDTTDGSQVWTYQALTEPARMLGATSPAVDNGTLVASFASGELVALRAANGAELWNVPLSRVSRTNALSEIRDIVGRPIIHNTVVLAVSHSDMMSSVDLRTGSQAWSLPISASTSPWASGDVVYMVDLSGRVVCISIDSGQVYWIRDLNEGLSPKKRVYWTSPVMASDRLILGSSTGEAVALDPKTGKTLRSLKLGSDALIGPIAADGMVYFVTDKAELVAIR